MKTIKIVLLFLLSTGIYAQKELEINKMVFRYEIIGDSIYGFIAAPTMGWLMIGFNDKNTTEQADFKFFAVSNQKAIVSDNKNIKGRNYPTDIELKGEHNIRLVNGIENENGSQFTFVLPLRTEDKNDFQHTIGHSFWLLLAYSAEDDFSHHSIMRKHLPFNWESTYIQSH